MRVRWVFLFALAIILLLLVVSTREMDTQAHSFTQKGVAYTAWWSGEYSLPDAEFSLANLASTGADWISLLATSYQDTITSTTIFTTTATPTDADLIHVITGAHNLGLKVMLKPHVNLLNDPNHWRGQIGEEFTTEAEWDTWFTAYQNFIFHYADIAETYGADQFCIGTELAGTAHRADDWRVVIAGIRARYDGFITYASNHSGEEVDITWWDAVDYIGVNAYYPLTEKNDPTLDELKVAWTPYITTLANLASTWEKSILFTEIGYRSQNGTNRHPWDWQVEDSIDLQEQVDAYQAAFESVYDQPWFAGIFWWEWGTGSFEGGICDDTYTPYDKPAEDILRAWYGAPPRLNQMSLQPDYSRTLDVYTDALSSGWDDWSWSYVTRTLAATDQVYRGAHAISITLQAGGSLALHSDPAFDSSPYHWLEFYVRGSSSGEQHLAAFFNRDGDIELRKPPVDDCRYMEEGTIEADTWKQVLIPLSDLNAENKFLVRFSIQNRSDKTSTGFWIDDIRLVGAAWEVYLPVVQRN